MQWGNDLLTWLATDDGQRVLFSSIVPAVAIVVAGLIAAATGSEKASGEGAGKGVVLEVYNQIGWIAVGVGVAVLVISPLIKKLMHLDTLTDDSPQAEAERVFGDGDPAARPAE